MTSMKAWKQRARSPHWPLGSVGRFYVKKDPAWGDAQGLMAVERLDIRNVRRIDTGFVVLAGDRGQYLFEVDTNGESAECVPWDDEMEREFQLHGEDIPPSYDMPEPEPEAGQSLTSAVFSSGAAAAAERVHELQRENQQRKDANSAEPIGIVTQTDPSLYPTDPENHYEKAANGAREWIRRDAEMARQRETEAADVEAHAEAERARQESGQ